jgi:hypothetical protein
MAEGTLLKSGSDLMTSPQRRKGTGFELAIVAYLKEHGFPFAERAYGAGRPDDRGDIDGIPGWCIEAKNHKSMDLAGWASEAAAEAANARCHWWAVIAKRRNRPIEDAYVVMPLAQFARLLAEDAPFRHVEEIAGAGVEPPGGATFLPWDPRLVNRTPGEWRG